MFGGKMKKLLTLLFIVSIFISLQSKEIVVNPNVKLFNTLYSNLSVTELEFNLDKYQITQIEQDGITFQKISYPMEGDLYQNGKPDLPVFTRFVAIPNKGSVTLKIETEDYETIDNILVYPRQNDDADHTGFDIDKDFYSQNIQFPSQIAQIRNPLILRDYRVVPVTFAPFQYNPALKSLKVYKKIKVVITANSNKGINEKFITHKKSRYFEKFYENHIVNYSQIKQRDDYQQPSLLIIYADNNNLAQLINILADWKKQKGFDVHMVSTAETTTNLEAIHDYIQTAYSTWDNPPEFVMLVGDANASDAYYIPTGIQDGGAGDQYYTLLEGDDILADVIIGRLSVDTQAKMQTVLNKILNYEKTPYLDQTDWYNKVILVGDASQSGVSTQFVNKYIKQVIQIPYPNKEFEEEYSGNFVNFMTTNLNEGALYFNYRGYIGMSGFGNSNIEGLSNGFMLPYVVDITCSTGNFNSDYDESRSETFLFAGTPTNPKGGIAAIGTSTASTHTCFNNIVSGAIYHSIFVDGITTAGGALTNAKYVLYLNYPQNPSEHTVQFSYWNNLMGDPSLELWTEQPKQMNVDYTSLITVGTNYVSAHCYDNNRAPLANVMVTVKSDDNVVFDTGYTDENGNVMLNVANANVGTINLTATKRNYIPAINQITVTSNYMMAAVSGYQLDDSAGNNDGQANAGEDLGVYLDVINNGSATVNNLSATIVSHSDNITVTNATVNLGVINAGQTVTSGEPFGITVNQDVLDGEKISLEIELSNGVLDFTDFIVIDIYAPFIKVDSYNLPGNPNMVLDPGETSNLSLTLQNLGSMDLSEVTATISCDNPMIDISDDSAYFANIPAGQSVTNSNDTFTLEASVELVPGMIISLNLDLTSTEGFHQQMMFNLMIGNPSLTDPLGPDSYGYYMYDDGDVSYTSVPTYNWIELDPGLGGDGTIISLNDSDDDDSDISVIKLPINFKIYGQFYDMITVCSDGWVSPGSHEGASFMNWTIPGPNAPMPLIAPFWDDLKMSAESKVLYKHFPESGMFVIEWSNLRNDYDESYNETFEAILYDYTVSPTSTGDSNIIFQYKEIHNVDQGEYGVYHVHHGQFATVGIQNETGTVGLEYTFNNTYPVPAKPLANEMAIAVTGKPISYENAYITYGAVTVNDDNNHNNQIDFGENIEMYVQLNNMGHQTAENVSAIISTTDQYVMLQNSTVNYPNIDALSSETNLQPFTFSVTPDVPNNHAILFNILITSSTDQWNYIISVKAYSADLQLRNVLYANDTNGNGLLDPGEMCDLIVKINNVGGSPLKNIHSVLSSTDPYLIINDNDFDVSHIYGNGDFALVYKITVLADAPEQYSIPINMDIQAAGGYTTSVNALISVGVMSEDFETGNFNLLPWEFPMQEWLITDETAASGQYSAQSPDIDDSQETAIQLSMNISMAGQISFYGKVSSETNYDYLRFFIDNTEMGSWSGELGWQQYTFDVSEGDHTFVWKYTKDGSVSHGSDCAWIDNIQFPGASGGGISPELMFNYNSFEETLPQGAVIVDTLDITNIGSGLVNYTISIENQTAEFVASDVVEGSVYTGHTNHIPIIFNSGTLDEGTYTADMVISDDRSQTTIPLTLIVQNVAHDNGVIPAFNMLYSNYPNPFNLSSGSKDSATIIKFAMKEKSPVTLEIYNLKGQKVKTLLRKDMNAGIHKIVWNGTNQTGRKVASGLYLYRLQMKGYDKIRKMVVIK